MYSSLFDLHEDVTICSYVPKRNKAVIQNADTNIPIIIKTTVLID